MEKFNSQDFFDALEYLKAMSVDHDTYVGQYFEKEYCPILGSIDMMYGATDLSSIEVPLTVKEMFESGDK